MSHKKHLARTELMSETQRQASHELHRFVRIARYLGLDVRRLESIRYARTTEGAEHIEAVLVLNPLSLARVNGVLERERATQPITLEDVRDVLACFDKGE